MSRSNASNKPTRNGAGVKRMNHFAAWKYVVLIVTVILLTLSAIPTWYGDKPAIQIRYDQTVPTVQQTAALLKAHDISPTSITNTGENSTIVFDSENDQSVARSLLSNSLKKEDQITFSYVSVAPNWMQNMGFEPIKLGLDLRGGVQFLLDVDINQAFAEKRDSMVDELKQQVRDDRLRGVVVKVSGDNGIQIDAREDGKLGSLRKFINTNYPNWVIAHGGSSLTVTPDPKEVQEFTLLTLQQNLKIMRDRIEELGITEALVQRQGEHSIRIELPGVQDPAQAKQVIGATASLAFHEAKSASDPRSIRDITVLDGNGQPVKLNKTPVITGEHIVDARASRDEMGRGQVNISLDHAGGKIMSDFSGKHIGKPMATVYREYKVDAKGGSARFDKVISVATIQSQLGTQFRITGSGSIEESQQLALLLRAGSLTAPVTIVEERTIGASLGAENISNGFAALALGLGLTLTFMAFWYRRLGWVANVALLTNMLCLLGLIALVPGAVLTLPGIAGLVLTVGMAVDTNVLIFERIKDKMAEGRSFAQSIDSGFDSALSTIMDANITTMITAVVLYSMGNGPIQGFALTLGLGLLTSMFTGIFASRSIINLIWGRDARRDVRV
ncbi:protein translocase subunit SecD [Vibrio tapetis]|uniref:Protein translocase subunit SecD n=1 Tax=Vibrio tapetis subsp. tapetis TaxID=1671868 RepID=A0A2N8ZIM5_9VIBR|nr:protein translocase subunit SecD [Vibrio tapetis]SON51747.1 SecYEG protein translocase auxillary subunit [Vibrio tapetis subsp. tapetis]